MNAKERKAARSRAARKAAATRRTNAAAEAKAEETRRVNEAARQAEASAAEARNAEAARQAEASAAEARNAEAARQAVTPAPLAPAPKPEKQRNWGWVWIPIIGLVLLCCLPLWWIAFRPFIAPAAPAANTQAPAAPAANTQAPAAPADGSDYQGTVGCQDGTSLDNVYADITRIPLGNREGASVYEISWNGSGFAGFDRIVLVLPRMDETHMGFVNNSRTVHGLRYCGFMKDIVAYASDPAHHVNAMQQSAQDSSGQRPTAEEIPVVLMELDGSIVITKAAPTGPSLDTIRAHLEMTPR